MKLSARQLFIAFFCISIVLGIFHAVASRDAINPDGIAYIEVAQSYVRGDWQSALSAYWSPLYAWLIALVFLIVQPPLAWELSVVHGLNFLIFICSFFAFHFLLNELEKSSNAQETKIPFILVRLVGYCTFLISSLGLIRIALVTPDMLVAVFVYLSAGLSVRFCRNTDVGSAILLGAVLALGYFAKTILFPLGLIFLVALALSVRFRWSHILKIGLALFIFLSISSLYIITLSKNRGYLTIGDSGPLVYNLQVNRVPSLVHWQGDALSGVPSHATRKVMDAPTIFEFRSPAGGTYAPWFDPAYWNQGMEPYFDWGNQLRAFTRNTKGLYLLTVYYFSPIVFLLFIFFWLSECSVLQFAKRIFSRRTLTIPALCALAVYFSISVEGRYVAPFLALLWIAILTEVSVSKNLDQKKVVHALVMGAATAFCFLVVLFSANDMRDSFPVFVGQSMAESRHEQIARGLRGLGVNAGDEVGVISQYVAGFESYWAHLAGVRIVAELPSNEANAYWFANDKTKDDVLKTFKKTGIRAVIMEDMRSPKPLAGWQRLGDTPYYVYLISQ